MDDSTSICESVHSTSTNSSVLRRDNQELLTIIHTLKAAFHHVKDAVVCMIEEPLQKIEKLTDPSTLSDKEKLRNSLDVLQKAVSLTKNGVKEMKKAMWTQSGLLDKLINCEDYKRLCDGDNISLVSTLDERENEAMSGQTRNLTLKTIFDEEVHGKWEGLMNESRNTRPHSAPCHRNNLAVIENTYQKREIPIEVEKSSSDMLHILASHIGEDEISVEVNQQKVSETLVEETTDRLVEAMSSRLAEWDSDKLIHVVSDKLVGSISTEIMHSVSEKVAAVVSDKLLESIKSKVYINGQSRKFTSKRKNKNLDLEERKPRYFIIKSCNEENVVLSTRDDVWSSTKDGNIRLNAAYNDPERKGPVYLFFSVNKSKRFCGIAKMVNSVKKTTDRIKWKDNNGRWQGCFDVRWIMVKNIPNDSLRHLNIQSKSKAFPVTISKDTQELSQETGKRMMEIFHSY